MPFDELVQVQPKPKKQNIKSVPRGCDSCTLNKVPGVRKIMGTVDGKQILIVGQSPGQTENKQGQEFVGDSGEFLWTELKVVGIRRSDCDVFNAIKCLPADLVEGSYNEYLKMRNPTPLEIHCCSIHTENIMTKSKARHILVLGQVAAKAFLQVRSVPQSKIFWSEKFQARIYLADHPSFFIRGYGAGARMEAFRGTIKQLAADWKSSDGEAAPDNFAYLRQQKYKLISTAKRAAWAGRIVKAYAKDGRRISVDIEYDIVDGKMVIFAIGFSPKPGVAFTFVFDYPGLPDQTEADAKVCWGWAKVLLENPDIKKVFHYGCSDITVLRQARVDVQGYDWDTNYSEYLYYPDEHNKYGLANIAERRFQQFSGYKSIIFDDLFAAAPPDLKIPSAVLTGSYDVKQTWLNKHDLFHLSNLKPDTLRLYNGADCDLTKRIEIDNKKKVPHALVRLYMDLGFLLMKMEKNGPWFDRWQHKKVGRLWPYREQLALQKVRDEIGDPEFNPGSPQQVYWAIYEHFELTYPLRKGKPNTQKKTLMMLSREHPFPMLIINWRKLSKAKSTYIDGPYEVARTHGWRVVTTWWATGTTTGRFSSSGGDDGGMNLQNLHKDPQLQNLYVADPRWREVFKAIQDILTHQPEGDWEECIEAWVRAYMPDLKTFLILDYGQLEIRVLAQVSGDKNLRKDCEGGDIHSSVGSRMTGWSVEQIKNDDKTRTLTKNCIAEGQRVLTDCGLVPIEKVGSWMLVWDGIDFVEHGGVSCQGERDVVEYGGLEATPDHEVWSALGRKVELGYAAAHGLELAISGDQETPVRYTQDCVEGDRFGQELSVCADALSCMQKTAACRCCCSAQRTEQELSLSEQSKIQRQSRSAFSRSVLRASAAVRKPAKSELGTLWRARDRESLRVSASFCGVCAEVSASSHVSGSGDRSQGQRRALRTGQFTPCDQTEKCMEHSAYQTCVVSGKDASSNRGGAQIEGGAWNGIMPDTGSAVATAGRSLAGCTESEGPWAVRKKKVYDILNAGPRHRFTVEGRLVSNCHFGIVYLISKRNLFDYIKAMNPDFDGTEEQLSDMVDRYFERYTGVAAWLESQQELAQEQGYVETLFGLHRALNITEFRGAFDEEEDYIDESAERQTSWRSQSCNTTVQGTGHQLLICGMVNIERKPEEYKVLGVPSLDVHDACYFIVNVLELQEAYRKAIYLLEKDSLETVKSDFPHINWEVPIVAEAKAGIRLGGRVKLKDDKFTVGGFLLDWFHETKKQILDLQKQLAEIPDAE